MATENNSKKNKHQETDSVTQKEDLKPSESKKLEKEASYTSEVKDKVKESMDKEEKE